MAWATTGDLDEFLAAAGGFLRSLPAEHTLLLTVAEALRARGPDAFGADRPRFGWWEDDDAGIGGAFLQTPPHPLLVTALPDRAMPELAELLGGAPPGMLNGPAGLAEALAERLGGAKVRRRERLYRLGTLAFPDPPPPGRPVRAEARHRDQAIAWYAAFEAEAHEPGGSDTAAHIDDRLSYGGLVMWEDDDGRPVSMAGTSRAVAGMVRVSLVYTPPEQRRRGFASAVTAAATRDALQAGIPEILLFTDLGNPTTNRIYQEIGYRPVADRVSLRLLRAGRPTAGGR
jgi:GNAT superfamily N-acetyltransferase